VPGFLIVNRCLSEIDHQSIRPVHALEIDLPQLTGPD